MLAERRGELEDCDCKQGMFPNPGRRRLVFAAGTTLAAAAAGFFSRPAYSQGGKPMESALAERAPSVSVPEDSTKVGGRPITNTSYGLRSPFETETRRRGMSPNNFTAWSMTPLEASFGVVTPSGLHYERHHNGVPTIDPARHSLFVHGLVERAKKYSMLSASIALCILVPIASLSRILSHRLFPVPATQLIRLLTDLPGKPKNCRDRSCGAGLQPFRF